MDYADERFLTWTSRLSVAAPANTNWNATYHYRWRERNSIPQEFVGFWLTNLQYRSYNGRILQSSLCGADAELVAAVARTFDVPLEHIECREMHTDCTAREFADPMDDYGFCESYRYRIHGDNLLLRRKLYNNMHGAVLVDTDEDDSFDENRVTIVGGCVSRESRYNGLSDYEANIDSSRDGQAYIHRATYLYFHVKYLKDYLRKNPLAV
ncbi:Hypothetical protein, putative [Bodo saltans]|uniref:Uncharacterized protein n=1 Tax=Bodo saltans TaxID=75058 RepID=A0A0S4IWE3_BODSA|nr:Hypothetical protein, putative [Bodo saltans]|eukprot:CUF32670.1 Hypothetical protein, putative [Bodo saltans]